MSPAGSAPLLRTRVRRAIVGLALFGLVVLAVPLGVAVERVVAGQTLTRLQRDATRIVALVPDNTIEAGAPPSVPTVRGTVVGVYDATGRRVSGAGPEVSPLALLSRDARGHDGRESGQLAVVVPVLSDAAVAGSIRAAVPLRHVWRSVLAGWALIAALALLALGLVRVAAGRVARRISEPFEVLTMAARSLGSGSFELELPTWGLAEADAAGNALQDTARELGSRLRAERAFTRDASHQLRTPLAGLLVELEAAQALTDDDAVRPRLVAATERARHLEDTIHDLLALRSPTGRGPTDAVAVAREAVRRWSTSPGRQVTLRADDVSPVAVPDAVLRQALDVLLDNALRHGGGSVTVTVEPLGERVVVEVADEGVGFPDEVVSGVGLRLAAEVVERSGGDLLLRRARPHPRVAVLLPTAPGQGGGSTSNR